MSYLKILPLLTVYIMLSTLYPTILYQHEDYIAKLLMNFKKQNAKLMNTSPLAKYAPPQAHLVPLCYLFVKKMVPCACVLITVV